MFDFKCSSACYNAMTMPDYSALNYNDFISYTYCQKIALSTKHWRVIDELCLFLL